MTEWYYVIGYLDSLEKAKEASEKLKQQVDDVREYPDDYPVKVDGRFVEVGIFEDSIGGDTAEEIAGVFRSLGARVDISAEADLIMEGISVIRKQLAQE